jgi:hypothetical protein
MLRFVFRSLAALAALVLPLRAQPASPPSSASAAPLQRGDSDWSRVSITRGTDDALAVSLESDLLRLDYGPDVRPGSTTVSKALALVHKPTGRQIGPFDSRSSPSRREFLTLRHAEQIASRRPGEVTVRLYFLTRIVDVTLLRGTTFARFDYTFLNDSRHTYDQMKVPGAPNHVLFFSGQKDYSNHMGWFGAEDPTKEASFAPYPLSFYRQDWNGGNFLDHHGWLIFGAGVDGDLGYGLLLPLAKLRWLKVMKSSGLERMLTENGTVYYYLVPEFSRERGLKLGEDFIAGLK